MNASEMLHEFFSAYLKVVFDYFIHKATINILTGMIRDYGCSPIRMFKKHVTALLSLQFKSKILKNF
jgi:hypothetical protein